MVWVVLEGGGSLCRGGADDAGACQPAWAVCALRTAPFRHCKEVANLHSVNCSVFDLTPCILSS